MSNSNLFNHLKKAVFLDRDGTINTEKEYLYRIEEFEFINGATDAICLLNRSGHLVIVVTNQSGVARGYYDEQDVIKLHQHIDKLLANAGARVDAWYYCPHHPQGRGRYAKQCTCRKPLPGMLFNAAEELAVDLSSSWMVGDKIADVEAGMAAGCRSVLVLTGYGTEERCRLPYGVESCSDIMEAAKLITAV